MNANFVILMLKYEKLEKNCNFLQRSYERFQMNTRDLKRFSRRDFNHQIPLRPTPIVESLKQEEKEIIKNPNSNWEFKNENNFQSLEQENLKSMRGRKILRTRRSLLIAKKNSTDVDFLLENDKSDYYEDEDEEEETEEDVNDKFTESESSEYRSSRARRDEGRGKEARKNKNKGRPKRSRRRLGTFVVIFNFYLSFFFLFKFSFEFNALKETRKKIGYNLNKRKIFF